MSRANADILNDEQSLDNRLDALLSDLDRVAIELDDSGQPAPPANDEIMRQLDAALDVAFDEAQRLAEDLDQALVSADGASHASSSALDHALSELEERLADSDERPSIETVPVPDTIDELDAQLAQAAGGDPEQLDLSDSRLVADAATQEEAPEEDPSEFATGEAIADEVAEDIGTALEDIESEPDEQTQEDSPEPQAQAADEPAPEPEPEPQPVAEASPDPAPESEATSVPANDAPPKAPKARKPRKHKRAKRAGGPGPIGAKLATAMSIPMTLVPPDKRVYVGYFGLISLFNAAFVWLALMMRG